jgi:cation:H+ antiporter
VTGDLLLLGMGLALLVIGAEALVRGGSGVARALGVSPFAIGLTIVGLGTSAPELAVNVDASLHGESALAFGNIIGSNLANLGLVLGLYGCIRPVPVRGRVLRRELPLLLLVTVAAAGMAWGGGPTMTAWSRAEGGALLALFAAFAWIVVADVVRQRRADRLENEVGALARSTPRELGLHAVLAAGGLVALIAGAELTVDGAVAVAIDLGLPSAVVGLTLVAVGTSLPEVATTLAAAVRGQGDLALGNVVGSNVANLCLIGGLSAAIHPVPLPEGGRIDLVVLCGLTALLLLPGLARREEIFRREAAGLLVIYVTFVTARLLA